MKRQSKLYLVFVLVLFFIIPLYKTQGMNDFNDKLIRSNNYYPLFDVTLTNFVESEPSRLFISRLAKWVFSPKMLVSCRPIYDEESSEVRVKPEIDNNITIDFTLNIPELYGLHCSLPALGIYENIAIRDENGMIVRNETAPYEEVGLYIDFQGEMSCDAIVVGNATGSGKLFWDNITEESFRIQHQEDAKPDYYFQVELRNFIYEVSLHVSYR